VPDRCARTLQFAAGAGAHLHAAGTIGALSVPNPGHDEGWGQYAREPRLAGPGPRRQGRPRAAGQRPGGRFNCEGGFALNGAHTWEEIAALAKKEALPTFDMPVRLRAHVESKTWRVRSPNVIGVIRSDPTLNEYVPSRTSTIWASAPVDRDSIYNGAMDNARKGWPHPSRWRALRKGPAPKAW
jgi:hypothetical protein